MTSSNQYALGKCNMYIKAEGIKQIVHELGNQYGMEYSVFVLTSEDTSDIQHNHELSRRQIFVVQYEVH